MNNELHYSGGTLCYDQWNSLMESGSMESDMAKGRSTTIQATWILPLISCFHASKGVDTWNKSRRPVEDGCRNSRIWRRTHFSKTRWSFRRTTTFFEILAIPILKIYRGFPYQFFNFLDIGVFLTNFGNFDFEIELFLAKSHVHWPTFWEIFAIPILKIYRGFPYQNFNFLDTREFLTNLNNSLLRI